MPKSRPIADLRAWRRREDRRLALTIILFLILVGGAAIGIVYGWGLVASGTMCLAGGAAIFGLLWLMLGLIERWLAREE